MKLFIWQHFVSSYNISGIAMAIANNKEEAINIILEKYKSERIDLINIDNEKETIDEKNRMEQDAIDYLKMEPIECELYDGMTFWKAGR